MTTTFKQHYDTAGYVVVPSLAKDLFSDLRDAADRAISRTRSGEWTLRRTVGKQFPPYDSDNPDSWGVQHLLHPALGEPVFAQWYTSPRLLQAVTELLDCTEDDLQMELFNLLINPVSHDFALRWHRDDVKGDVGEEEEFRALQVSHYGVQWNTALYDDSCLFVVPGSHKTPRSAEQRAHSTTMDPPKDPLDMPGSIRVNLKAGDTVFYNSNMLHCATYSTKAKRATLHACIGNVAGGDTRARNILQHGLTWMNDDSFRSTLTPRGHKMLDNLTKLQKSSDASSLGYSLD